MTKGLIAEELDLESLEKIKVKKEIAELSRPLLQRPAFLGATASILATAGALGFGFYTDLFDLERKRLQNETVLLEINKSRAQQELRDAESEFVARQEAIKVELQVARDKLETDRKELSATLEKERASLEQKLDQDRQALVAQFALDSAQLEDKLDALNLHIENKEAELILLQRQLAAPQTHSLIESFRGSGYFTWNHNGVLALIARGTSGIDATKQEIIKNIKTELDGETDVQMLSAFYYILHMIEPSSETFEDFLTFLGQNWQDEIAWRWLGGGYWDAEYQLPAMIAIIDHAAADKLSRNALVEASFFFYSNDLDTELITQNLRHQKARPLIKKAADASLITEENLGPLSRQFLLILLSYVSPQAATLSAGIALAGLDRNDAAEFEAVLEEMLRDSDISSLALREAMQDMGLDEAIKDGEVTNWLGSSEFEELVSHLRSNDKVAAYYRDL